MSAEISELVNNSRTSIVKKEGEAPRNQLLNELRSCSESRE